MLLEDGLDLSFGKRSIQFAFLVLDLRKDVFGKLFDDVIGLRRRQAFLHRMKVTINDLHSDSLYSAHAPYHEAHLAKAQRNLSQLKANLRQHSQRGVAGDVCHDGQDRERELRPPGPEQLQTARKGFHGSISSKLPA